VWGLGKVAERGDEAQAAARGYYERAAEMLERLGLDDESRDARSDLRRVTGSEGKPRL
jgi:hypothetical protein